MTKIVSDDITSGYNQQRINDNFDKLVAEVNNNTLSRDNPTGSPNQMEVTLDMNLQKIINLAKPINDNDAVRFIDIGGFDANNTNITIVPSSDAVEVHSSSGTPGTINAASSLLAGVMTGVDKGKLDGIPSNATDDQTGDEIVTAINTELGNEDWQTGTGTAASLTVTRTTAFSHGLVVGQVVDRESAPAQSDDVNTTAVGFVASLIDANNYKMQYTGPIFLTEAEWIAQNEQGTALEAGQFYFTSKTTAGKITSTAPTGTDISDPVGLALSPTTMLALPYLPSAPGDGSEVGAVNLAYTPSVNSGLVAIDAGTDATILAADGVNAGLMLAAEKTKLAALDVNAAPDQTGAEIVSAVDTELGNITWKTQYTLDKAKVEAVLTGAITTHSHALPTIAISDVTSLQTTLDAKLALAGGSLTGPLTTDDVAVNGVVSNNITAVGALDIDCAQGNYFTKTVAANTTFTISNVPSGNVTIVIELTNAGAFTTAFPASVIYNGGVAPTLTAAGVDLIVMTTDNSGTTWRAAALLGYTS